jgi:hypothetical protein
VTDREVESLIHDHFGRQVEQTRARVAARRTPARRVLRVVAAVAAIALIPVLGYVGRSSGEPLAHAIQVQWDRAGREAVVRFIRDARQVLAPAIQEEEGP